jgi:hypothetical protein
MPEPRIYTSPVEIDLEVMGEYAQIRFCDTGASYWDGSRVILTEQKDADLVREIAASIKDEATELARSMVADMRRRTNGKSLKQMVTELESGA